MQAAIKEMSSQNYAALLWMSFVYTENCWLGYVTLQDGLIQLERLIAQVGLRFKLDNWTLSEVYMYGLSVMRWAEKLIEFIRLYLAIHYD